MSAYSIAVGGTPGLVGYWRLDETSGTTAGDATGSNPGTYTGTAGTDYSLNQSAAQTNLGTAVRFPGAAGYVAVPAISVVAPMSVECWVRLQSGQINQQGALVCKNPVNTDWILMVQNGHLIWRPGATGSDLDYTLPGGWDNVWHHVVATQTGTSAVIYVDGSSVASGTVNSPGNGMSGGNNLTFGKFTGGYQFNGYLDEIALYNVALSAGTVAAHYAASTAVANPYSPDSYSLSGEMQTLGI